MRYLLFLFASLALADDRPLDISATTPWSSTRWLPPSPSSNTALEMITNQGNEVG